MLVSVNLELLRKFCKKKRYFLENLHSWHKFYVTAGCEGRDKFPLCILPKSRNGVAI